jgi:beta-galactosidase
VTALRHKISVVLIYLIFWAETSRAQILTDLGAVAPTAGSGDIYQFNTAGNQTDPDGLNYYTDNQSSHNAGEPGQSFTTGTNLSGYILSAVALKTAGLSSYIGISNAQPYFLHIYSVSNGRVTLRQTCKSANVAFTDGDWLRWNGLNLPLAANAACAWSFGKASATNSWEALAVASGNPYAGGEIGLFPPAGGPVDFGSSHAFDAVFDLSLSPAETPSINQLTLSPTNNVFAGTLVTFSASVTGAQPLYFQWQFNAGNGYVSVTGSNTNTLAFNATITNTGSYQLVLTNNYGAVTSAPISLSVTLDTNPPVVTSAFNLGATNVEVDFSKALEASTATNLENYVFINNLAITAVTLATGSSSVILTVAPLADGSNYTLVINGILDEAAPANPIAMNTTVSLTASPRHRTLLDAGWRFEQGDPPDVTTNVTYYPEISDLAKLEAGEVGSATNINSEAYMETVRTDPIATHAGENVSYVQTNYDDSGWRLLNLPHDWAVELPFNASADGGHGFKPVGNSSFGANNLGWYRHTFTLPANAAGQALWLEFDGAYRNCLVWLNGHILGRNVSGYESFYFDATPYAIPGGTNVLVVRVDASRFEGWFYEGAGIYRHVWLTTVQPVHVAECGTFVATTKLAGSNATVTVQTDVTNQSGAASAGGSLTSTINDGLGHTIASVASPVSVPPGGDLVVTQTLTLTANLWSPQTPYLYHLTSTVSNQNAASDIYQTPFGVRTVSIDSTNGVFINGRHLEIQGMCNHQDHAAVGSALPDRLQYYRVERLKEMGVNACRTSHNEPTPEFLDACDQLGMLVLDENRRLGTNAEPLGELTRQIRRDRNHPSVFMWSLANEEPLQGTAIGASIIQAMQNQVHSLDNTRLCTAALNSWGSGFSSVLDVNGFNYQLGAQDSFHAGNPGWPIIGTETSSLVSDRGVYTNDTINGYVWGYDVENTAVNWGEPAEAWWPYYDSRPWSSGGFSWTGLDYRGEPTPYGWPCVNSHFGSMDTCGFPKDNFYYYQANWTMKPVLHVFPHWNWPTVGQPVKIWAFGNCQAVELFTNGVSIGRQALNRQGHVEWDSVPYAPGALTAVGYNYGVAVMTNTVTTTGPAAAVALWPDRSTILADGRDVSVVTVAVLDSQGLVVPTATNLINFTINGGSIIGVGNGDPSSHEADRASNQRSVFNGLAQVIVQSTLQPGAVALTASSTGLTSTNIFITTTAVLPPPSAPAAVSAISGNSQVAVTWDVVPGATTYNLWRATIPGGPYNRLAGGIGSVNLGYLDTNVTNLTTYYYVVTANGNGTSSNSAEVRATPMAVVQDVTSVATSNGILVSWAASPGSTYNLKRSAVSGGPYTVIAAATTATNFLDAGVESCEPFFYVVTITNNGFESLDSPEVTAEVPGPVPLSLSNADVGPVGAPGNASYCNGQFSISGAGADIWGTTDAFQFVYAYIPFCTNCDMRVRVAGVLNTSGNAKSGVMIRQSLDPGSMHALVDVEPTAGIEFIYRPAAGGAAVSAVVSGEGPPNWVRLTRTNNLFTGYWSADGNTWNEISAATIPMTNNGAYVGLAVCSHAYATLTTSLMNNFEANFAPTNAPTLAAVSNQTVNVGQTVTVTASATNTIFPLQTVTFNLPEAPPGATLTPVDNNQAVFNWRPGVANAGTTIPVIMEAGDFGLSNLTASQSFAITVNPLALPTVPIFSWNDGQFTLLVSNGIIGPDYAVQTSTNLKQWNTLFITNSPSTGSFEWTDTNVSTAQAQFYRIKIGPPPP